MSWRHPVAGLVLAWSLCNAAPGLRAEEPSGPTGSAYLRTLSVVEPPFGTLQQDVFPWDGVHVQRWRRDDPGADWLLVWIDLQTPGLGYAASPVDYRHGPGGPRMQYVPAQTTVDFLRAHGETPRVDLAVNTVAFWPTPAYDGYPVYLSEPVWQGGDTEREPAVGSLMLGLLPGQAIIGDAETVRSRRPVCAFGSFLNQGESPDGAAVRDGTPLTFADTEPHGRTMAGVSPDGRVLILLVVDGYNPARSMGLSMAEAARVLRAAGAYQAIFLDGGGSSTLVGRGDDGKPAVLNRPSGLLQTPGTLRYVAVNLGFTGLRRGPDPVPALEGWEAPFLVRAWTQGVTWVRVYPGRARALAAGVSVLLIVLVVLWYWRRRVRLARQTAKVSGVSPLPPL